MVVLLIIAILLAIAIPTFLGVSGSANDRSAQSNLTNALTEMKALYQNAQSYNTSPGMLPSASLSSAAPEFAWGQAAACTPASGGNCVSEYPVDVATGADGAGVILAALSKTSICWYAVDLTTAPVPAATFNGGSADSGTGFTKQFLPGTANGNTPNMQKAGGAGLTSAGVFYSQKKTTTCDARTPTTNATAWTWGPNYAGAPTN